jgi:O-methyltransferase
MGTLLRAALNAANAMLRPINLAIVHGSPDRVWRHASSPNITHRKVLPHATYSPWLDDDEFRRCYEIIRGHTLVDIYRCYELWQLGKQLAGMEGSFLEVGVWRGGTGCLLAQAAENRVVYLADTFAGVVKAGENDPVYVGGEHADTSEETVRDLIARLGLRNTRLLRGVFPEDTASEVREKLALVHCDVDVYSSARATVEWALPRLLRGGVIVFDDYGFSGCEGVTKLVNELRERAGLRFVHNLNGHALLIKIAD